MAQFESALAVAPDFADAHFSLGELLARDGRYGEAIARYQAAVRSRSNYVDARMGLADTLSLAGRLAEAEAAFEGVVEIDPASDQAWMGREWRSSSSGRHRRHAIGWTGRSSCIPAMRC